MIKGLPNLKSINFVNLQTNAYEQMKLINDNPMIKNVTVELLEVTASSILHFFSTLHDLNNFMPFVNR